MAGVFQLETDLTWYLKTLSNSNISESMAEFAEIKLVPGGIQFPYFDIRGNATPMVTQRNNVADKSRRYMKVAGMGTPHLSYWPRVRGVDHFRNMTTDVGIPLFIVEGEKKALCLQAELLRVGLEGSVVAMNGVDHLEALKRSCDGIVWTILFNKSEVRRPVWLVFDFNPNPEEDSRHVRRAEARVIQWLSEVGGDAHLLRWPVDIHAGEQKIDDWIVAGGDISSAFRYSIENAPEIEQMGLPFSHPYFNGRYAKIDSGVVRLSDAKILRTAEFKNLYSHRNEWVLSSNGKQKKVYHPVEWLDWPLCPRLDGTTFLPRSVSHSDKDDYPEIVNNRLNLFTGWPVDPVEGDVTPWIKHLEHMFPIEWERKWVECWIAHMFQFPEDRVSTYLAVFSRQQGTGKGLLLETLAAMLGKYYCRGSRESWLGRFNGGWNGKLLISTDDMATHTRKERDAMAERVKECCANEKMTVQSKGLDETDIESYARFIFTGNDVELAYVQQGDRRAACFSVPHVMDPAVGTAYGNWMRANVPALLWWAANYDLGGWDSKQRAPRTAGRAEVMDATTPAIDQLGEMLRCGDVYTGVDVVAINDLLSLYGELFAEKWYAGASQFGRRLRESGAISESKLVKVGGIPTRLVSLRDHDLWRQRDGVIWARAYQKGQSAGQKM